ncbi:MAG: hypothetical protein V1797_11360 [Pseudomonadota bacterium]
MGRSVAIIGLGRIGRMLAKLLLTQAGVSEQRHYSRSARPGFSEELRQANRHGQRLVAMESPADLGRASHVFLSFAFDFTSLVHHKQVDDEWAIEMQGNLPLLRAMLPGWADLSGRTFIVYTNPVDVVCTLLARALPAGNAVFGFGSSLDSLRLRCLVDPAGMMLGEHGISMVPVGLDADRTGLMAARRAVVESVRRVTIHQGYTLLAPELASAELLDALCGHAPALLPLSAPSAELGLHLGQPCQVAAWGITPRPFSLGPAETALWQESVQKIRNDLELADL